MIPWHSINRIQFIPGTKKFSVFLADILPVDGPHLNYAIKHYLQAQVFLGHLPDLVQHLIWDWARGSHHVDVKLYIFLKLMTLSVSLSLMAVGHHDNVSGVMFFLVNAHHLACNISVWMELMSGMNVLWSLSRVKALQFHQVSRHSQVHTTARHNSLSIWPYLSFVLGNVCEHNGIGLCVLEGYIHPVYTINCQLWW